MLHHFSLSKSFWRESLIITNYFQNKSPTKKIANHKIFIEIWFGIKPNIFYLKPFDCKNFSLVHKENRPKLDTHIINCIFWGYNEEAKTYGLLY